MAKKRHVQEVDAKRRESKAAAAQAEVVEAAEAMRQQLLDETAEERAKRVEALQRQSALIEKEQKAERDRMVEQQRRAMARAEAVAAYEEASKEAKKEAEERAWRFKQEKETTAGKRLSEYDKRRQEALSKKEAAF